MIKKKEKQTALFIGTLLVQNCEDENSRIRIGFDTSVKEATKRGSSIPRIPERSYCTFVLFKDTLVGI